MLEQFNPPRANEGPQKVAAPSSLTVHFSVLGA